MTQSNTDDLEVVQITRTTKDKLINLVYLSSFSESHITALAVAMLDQVMCDEWDSFVKETDENKQTFAKRFIEGLLTSYDLPTR